MKKRERAFQPFVLRPFYYIHVVACDVFVDALMVPTFVVWACPLHLHYFAMSAGRVTKDDKIYLQEWNMINLSYASFQSPSSWVRTTECTRQATTQDHTQDSGHITGPGETPESIPFHVGRIMHAAAVHALLLQVPIWRPGVWFY